MKLDHVDPRKLKPHPRNYLSHPAEQIEHLRASIQDAKEWARLESERTGEPVDASGFYRNVVISHDGFILAGHGVTEAAIADGCETIPVYRVPFSHDDARATKLLVGDNEQARLARKDQEALAKLLTEISDSGPGALLGTGMDDLDLEELGSLLELSFSSETTSRSKGATPVKRSTMMSLVMTGDQAASVEDAVMTAVLEFGCSRAEALGRICREWTEKTR